MSAGTLASPVVVEMETCTLPVTLSSLAATPGSASNAAAVRKRKSCSDLIASVTPKESRHRTIHPQRSHSTILTSVALPPVKMRAKDGVVDDNDVVELEMHNMDAHTGLLVAINHDSNDLNNNLEAKGKLWSRRSCWFQLLVSWAGGYHI